MRPDLRQRSAYAHTCDASSATPETGEDHLYDALGERHVSLPPIGRLPGMLRRNGATGACIICDDPLGIGEAFSDFGSVAPGFIAGESACTSPVLYLHPRR